MPRISRNPDDFPTLQFVILGLVRLSEPIALTSIFPYAWALVKRFEIGNEDDASFYAGLLISSFSFAEALMGMFWGGLSDRIGRKPVLLIGCIGTMFSLLIVGLAESIWIALLGRALGGLLNGNIAVIQTMVMELVKKPEHEPRAFSIMPFVWCIGTIIGPFIGGTFADPYDSYPDLFPEGSLFERFPYLLPNLICACLLLMSTTLGYFLLEETHPDMQPLSSQPDPSPIIFVSEETPLIETSDALKRPAVDLRDENYGTIRTFDGTVTPSCEWDPKSSKALSYSIFCKPVMAVVIALGIFSYHSMAYDHLLPIFFEDDKIEMPELNPMFQMSPFYSPGGLGLSVRAVGLIMAVNGAIALFMQAVVFPILAERFGVYRLFIFVTVFHPIAFLIVPSLLYVSEEWLYPAIYAILAVRNFFVILVFPLLLILLKEATPNPKILGKVNGLASSACAGCRMVAPPVAGVLYTMGRKMDCTALAWYGSAAVAVLGAVQCFWVRRCKARQQALEVEAAVCEPMLVVGADDCLKPGQQVHVAVMEAVNEGYEYVV